jgi:predicted DsbA family dithiol-disulfide isomerase
MDFAEQLGLDAGALAQAMGSGAFTNEVIADIQEAQQLGLQGVPFFVFDRKYGVSGAQEPAVFLETLEVAFKGE